ncbi:radical SAM protein [Gammaproteobacteria bacterium]|nr:radical SAM protein [Gammaproteobacteria bacterium]
MDVQLNVYNLEAMLAQPPQAFAFVRFDPNNDCNVRCAYCHNHRSAATVATADLRRFVEENVLSTEGFQIGCIMEPTLDPRLAELFELIGDSPAAPRVVFSMHTNGILLHRHDPQRMVAAGLNEVVVSVDTADSSVHKALRGGTSLTKVTRNVGNLCRAFPDLRVDFATTVTTANASHLEELVLLGIDLGVAGFTFREMFHHPESDVVEHARLRTLKLRHGVFAALREQITARFGKQVHLIFTDAPTLVAKADRTDRDSLRV